MEGRGEGQNGAKIVLKRCSKAVYKKGSKNSKNSKNRKNVQNSNLVDVPHIPHGFDVFMFLINTFA